MDIFDLTDNISKQQHSSDYCIQRIPILATIVKVACEFKHVLALTNQGNLYVWGKNNHGQLGTGDREDICKPLLLNTSKLGKLSDIAALNMKNISVAVNETGCFYVWDDHEYANKESNIIRCLRDAFDDPSTSDFKVQVEGRDIHVHKAILKIRSSHFRTMFQNNWQENTEDVLNLNMFSYNVYKAYLKYLYTEMIDIPSEELLELLQLADMYDEINLKTDSISLIRRRVTISNVAFFYKKAIECNEKRLEEFCFSILLRNIEEVIQTESFAELDAKTKNILILKAIRADLCEMVLNRHDFISFYDRLKNISKSLKRVLELPCIIMSYDRLKDVFKSLRHLRKLSERRTQITNYMAQAA
nr:PREDICTED: RCC1 and BTB domain-containing protein 1-like [Linepithema humile]